MTIYGVFQHMDHDGIVTGSGYVVRSRNSRGEYARPYTEWAPVWSFIREADALSLAEKLTRKVVGPN